MKLAFGTVQTLRTLTRGEGGKQSVTTLSYCINNGQNHDIGRGGGGVEIWEFCVL